MMGCLCMVVCVCGGGCGGVSDGDVVLVCCVCVMVLCVWCMWCLCWWCFCVV